MFSFLKCPIPQICHQKHLDLSLFSQLKHLPFPEPMDENKEKFKHFSKVFGKNTSEIYRPSAIEKENSKPRMPFSPSSLFAENTGMVIQCSKCGNWRAMYSKYKLKKPQMNILLKFTEEFLYTRLCMKMSLQGQTCCL